MIPLFKVFMSANAPDSVKAVLESGYIGQGPRCEELEDAVNHWLGTDKGVLVNSGTSAIHLALRMIKDDVQLQGHEGRDEVITTPITCTATNWPILANGLKIRWADVDMTCNIDVNDVRRKISPRTLAIMAVHWGGYPCDMEALSVVQDQAECLYGFRPPIIEDCAHALGASYSDRQVGVGGNFRQVGVGGNFAAFSFQAIKPLTMGDGGFLVCPGKWHASKVSRLRWYGLSRESSTDMRCLQRVLDWGYKFNSNDIAAATGLANLPHLDGILDQYRANGQFYDEELYSRDSVIAQPADRYKDASYWLYTLLIENRSEFQRAMADAGIATSQVHSRTDTHQCVDAYKSMLPGVDYVDSRMVCIPSGWWITPEDRQYIVDTMKKGW